MVSGVGTGPEGSRTAPLPQQLPLSLTAQLTPGVKRPEKLQLTDTSEAKGRVET